MHQSVAVREVRFTRSYDFIYNRGTRTKFKVQAEFGITQSIIRFRMRVYYLDNKNQRIRWYVSMVW